MAYGECSKVEPAGFANGVDVGIEQRRVSDDLSVGSCKTRKRGPGGGQAREVRGMPTASGK